MYFEYYDECWSAQVPSWSLEHFYDLRNVIMIFIYIQMYISNFNNVIMITLLSLIATLMKFRHEREKSLSQSEIIKCSSKRG